MCYAYGADGSQDYERKWPHYVQCTAFLFSPYQILLFPFTFRYVQELVDCGKEYPINDPECADEKDFVAFYEETDVNFCKNPMFPRKNF
jgi:hypothetical protein